MKTFLHVKFLSSFDHSNKMTDIPPNKTSFFIGTYVDNNSKDSCDRKKYNWRLYDSSK